MFFALLTAICWSFAGFGSSRISRTFGTNIGNGMRLLLSTLVLFLICVLSGTMFLLPGQPWFMLAGILHLTLGDIGLFAVYRRLAFHDCRNCRRGHDRMADVDVGDRFNSF